MEKDPMERTRANRHRSTRLLALSLAAGMALCCSTSQARSRAGRSSLLRVEGRALARLQRANPKVRPTPTAPRVSLRQLTRMGVEVYARPGKHARRRGDTTDQRLVFRPGKGFDSQAARALGLVSVTRKGSTFLTYRARQSAQDRGGNASLYPRKRRSLAASFSPTRGRVKVAFFDADSTLRVSRSGAPSADSSHDMVLLPAVARKIKTMAKKGYLIAIVSNQGGVHDGYVTQAIADSALRNTCRLLSKAGAPVHYYDYATGYNKDRKPHTGMGDRLARMVRKTHGKRIDWKRSVMVGDSAYKRGHDVQPNGRTGEDFSNSDRRFADNLRRKVRSPKGLKFYHPRDFFGWAQKGVRNFRTLADVNAFLAR